MPLRDVSLLVDVVGRGHPLVLMNGGPGLDRHLLLPFRRCQDRCTVVFYDHRCNGGSPGRSRLVHDLGGTRRRCAIASSRTVAPR
jgi:pimeloyl-ACP methyl ester carboxylesterase